MTNKEGWNGGGWCDRALLDNPPFAVKLQRMGHPGFVVERAEGMSRGLKPGPISETSAEADFSAALRNDQQEGCGMTNKRGGRALLDNVPFAVRLR
jgi:hypothetical protein